MLQKWQALKKAEDLLQHFHYIYLFPVPDVTYLSLFGVGRKEFCSVFQ